MLIRLKRLLDTYSEEELNEMDLWIDAKDTIKMICVEDSNITLVTEDGLNNLEINGNIW